jgi:micrococcal nuclease
MNRLKSFWIPLVIIIICIGVLSYLIYLPFKNNSPSNFLKRLAAEKTIRTTNDLPENSYPVLKVVDGDTIDVLVENQLVRVRLLGINSPESVDPRRHVECFGKEASRYLKSILGDSVVRLEKDRDKPDTDEYGRWLRYVYMNDVFINRDMIANGYAYEYTYHNEQYQFQDEFKNVEKNARELQIGLWNKDTCDGKKNN